MTPTYPAIVDFLASSLDAYLADLNTLVAMDSYSYDPDDVNRVNDWLRDRLQRMGLAVERRHHPGAGDDLVATLAGRGRGRILLLGHSDTVFPRGTAAQRPLSTDGDKLLGPGVCDMKGGLLAGLYAMAALQQAGCADFESVRFLIVSDEEVAERHSPPLIQAASRAADAVLTLEAARANGDIVTARKGVLQFTVEAFGRAAHAGVEPEKGRNAILALAHHAVALAQLNDPAQAVTVNVGVIQGGTLPNVVPDYARMQVDVRAFTPEVLDAARRRAAAVLERAVVPDVQVRWQSAEVSPPMPRTAAVARLEALAVAIAAALGFPLRGAATGGGADSAIAAAAGVPALDGLGPIGGLDHGPDEYILRSSIVPRTALLAHLILALGTNRAIEMD